MTEFTVFATADFMFSFTSQKSQNKWHENVKDVNSRPSHSQRVCGLLLAV